jgi:hypothetical protein
MTKLKCNLIVKETQSASAKVLDDLKQEEDKDFNIEEVFENKALKKDEDKDITGIINKSPTDNK